MKANAYQLFFYFTMFLLSISLVTTQGCKENPCSEIVCLNGGICAGSGCICPEGFRGERCQNLDGESCGNEICLNGGACVNNTCECPPGWSGANCSIQVPNPCDNITCLNGGVCVNGNCNCPPDFSGQFCEINEQSNPCDNVVCQNGGTCVNGDCDCPSGFTGPNCETEVSTLSGQYDGTIECFPIPAGSPITMHDVTIIVTPNGDNLSLEFLGLFNTTVEATPNSVDPDSFDFMDGSFEGTAGFFNPDELTLSVTDGTPPDQQSCSGTLTR